MLRLGVIGYGYWGPNLVRNFHAQPDCRVVAICDQNPASFARAQAQYPEIATTADAVEVLTASGIDAVAIATTRSPARRSTTASTCSWRSRSLPLRPRPRI